MFSVVDHRKAAQEQTAVFPLHLAPGRDQPGALPMAKSPAGVTEPLPRPDARGGFAHHA